MRASFRLGRIVGVPVGVNWSVLVIFLLIAWALSANQFPRTYPDRPGFAYVLAGLAAAVVFFLGLLAHEVSHAVVAKRNGLEVGGITLWLFGGVAELKGEAPNPGAELRIAGIGPLVSLLIGAFFGVIAAGLAMTGYNGLWLGALAWLAGINVLLAVFNVLPAAPLDGGRLLRAAVWKATGDRTKASVVAARAGWVLGALLIGLGFWQFFAGGGFGGLWLILIGWFLIGAAGMEERQARMGSALHGLRVADVMTPQPQTASGDMTVADFVGHYLFAYRHSALPLVEDDRPVGLVTLDRVRGVPADQRYGTTLAEVACRADDLVLASPDESLNELLPRLSECADGRALVVVDGRLVGIVSPSDISRAAQRGSMREQMAGRPVP
ncbi:site-2 protease family protein [Salinispora arenicola]|uniref:Zinc metalloprotease n=2 Tax=Salinispora arenicola TaxID=168697 RepID=A0A542XNY3_SALAC|nr:site-2 protease family protein [Salinispora arenicola]MCN0153862.1 site-2 protease family protein [Salinispora arenicola]MCN0181291.1 site-2 protease family protein [Salinispora arenicola]NIL59018.1 CBS domain-containing protein [Salinispora arenicola]NIL60126.1 CBS domain-containing protein [Salinispora arenicola]TQL37567.1 Zn-dependent protease [Salinispora arenicola]